LDGFDDVRVAVTVDYRPHGGNGVDVAFAVRSYQMVTLTTSNDHLRVGIEAGHLGERVPYLLFAAGRLAHIATLSQVRT